MNRSDRVKLVAGVTLGGILEWYEIFLYVYWAPQISQIFFSKSYGNVGIIETLLIFAFGFLARPLGGLLFGYIGDRFGRKLSFICTIIFCTLPTFIVALIPSYATWGIASQIILGATRFLQGIPAGGELPGAMCYLYESAPSKNRFYLSSFAFIGAQVGGILGILECVIFEMFLPNDQLLDWGWRLSFALGGLLGLFGFYLRKTMHETPMYLKLNRHDHILQKPIYESFKQQKKAMLIAFFISIFEVIAYFTVAVFPTLFYGQIFSISSTQNFLITACVLTLSAVTIPFFGKLGDRFSSKHLMVAGSISSFVLCWPLYFSILNSNFTWTIVSQCLLVLSLNMQFALLPGILAHLFPTNCRFTCLGFSFNLCDSLIGGLTPALALCCVGLFQNHAAFLYLVAAGAILNLWLYTGQRSQAILQKNLTHFFWPRK